MDRYRPDVVKGCPVCRVRSDFYVPSESMMEGEEKEQLIISTKQRCREDFCSFFDQSGFCPFEEDCRYLTARRPEHQEEEEGAEEDDSDAQCDTTDETSGFFVTGCDPAATKRATTWPEIQDS
ncbi:putative E3 ubiquitin-protein ligase makorin-4 [Takifugu rubripes]|uniref:putative E3 ubiquitin-protein ligase makorin-4 n=1 Tax=Takifugu rubripes TaxID=31033 RepID=UPI001145DC34|nr:putative E3 ubiquitin-protein ligase makorin-4 [Takifugu rubripes]